MSESEKILFVKILSSDESVTDEQISAYLALSSSRIKDRLYLLEKQKPDVLPIEYGHIQCELAVRMIARRGGEGEISHSENGISRSWKSVDDEDILQRIPPYVGVLL